MTTVFPQLTSALEDVGLTKNEARLYLAALELGPSSIVDLARHSGIKRPTCYVVLDALIKKGLASKSAETKRALYVVEPPEQLVRLAKQRLDRLADIEHELVSLGSRAETKPTVRLYEGKAGIQQTYAITLDQPKGSELLFIGTPPSIYSQNKIPERYIQARLERGLPARLLLADDDPDRNVSAQDRAELRQTRFLSAQKFDTKIEVIIFGQAIAYIAHHETHPFALLIENPTIAHEERQRFELLWEMAEPATV